MMLDALLAATLWVGSARVDVMIWEPGGEHPYTTDFELEYREADPSPIHASNGAEVGRDIRLVPLRIATRVQHTVRGLLNCSGSGQEVITDGPAGAVFVPFPGWKGVSALGTPVPAAGAYQIVLPRAVGAFACGTKKNAGDRWVVVGSGLFHPAGDVDAADRVVRSPEAAGTRMRGSFSFSDVSQHRAVRHDYRVTWDLRRRVQP